MKIIIFYFSCFLLVIAGLLSIGLFFYWGIIHPVWSIVDAVASDRTSSEVRVLWMVVILLTWTLGSLFYSFLGTKSNRLRKSTKISLTASLVALVIFVIGGVFFGMTYPGDSPSSSESTSNYSHQPVTSSVNAGKIKQECLSAASWMFSRDAVEVCKNPTPHTAKCIIAASWMFSNDAVKVCNSANADTAECVAGSRSMFSRDAVTACKP